MQRSRWLELLALVGLPLVVFAHSLGNDFVMFDDELLIIDNPKVRGFTVENVTKAFTTYDPELYVPLTLLTYQVEYSLFDLNPVAYHVTSLIIHIASTIVAFAIFCFFFDRRVALVCALLFGVHPMNVEAVSWASGRKDLLASFFFLLSLWLYLRWREGERGYKASVTTYAFGLLSKVSVVPLPFALVLIDWFRGRTIDRACLKEKLPYFILTLLFIVIALIGKEQASHIFTWVLLAFVSIPFYLAKYVAPFNLSLFYPFTEPVSFLTPSILLGIGITLIVTLAVAFSMRRTRKYAFAFVWFLLLLAPSFPTVLKGAADQEFYPYFASDRYVYLAGLGLLFLLGTFLRDRQWRWILPIIALFAVLTYKQSMVWRDSEALFASVVAQERPSYVAYMNLGGIYAERGELDRALELYERSIAIHPSSIALQSLGQILTSQGRNDEAIEIYSRLLEIWPRSAGIHLNVGTLYMFQGNAQAALPYLEQAVEFDPSLLAAHFNLGILYEHLGDIASAIEQFEAAYALDPTDEQARRKVQEHGKL